MRILLTGASGLVGHSVIESTIMKAHEVLTPRHQDLDLLDADAVLRYLQNEKPDCIVHAAGKVGGIAANCRNSTGFLLENLDMGKNLIYGAFQAGVKKLLNLGSSCMYPRNSTVPLTEDMVLKGELEPTNEGYALAKIMCARLCEYISREYSDFQYKTLIPCNLYGRWDKFRTMDAHMIPAVIHKIHIAKTTNSPTVEIWGTGEVRREFMYSGDLADCIAYCLEHFEEMPTYLNAGLGHDYTVNEYYETIAEIIGYKGNFVHDLSKPEGMKRKLTDVRKAHAFGWKAKTTLVEGIKKTYDFYREELIENQ